MCMCININCEIKQLFSIPEMLARLEHLQEFDKMKIYNNNCMLCENVLCEIAATVVGYTIMLIWFCFDESHMFFS